jgi:hypothetical protein
MCCSPDLLDLIDKTAERPLLGASLYSPAALAAAEKMASIDFKMGRWLVVYYSR